MKNKILAILMITTIEISTGQNICLASNKQDSLKTPELENFGSSKTAVSTTSFYSYAENDSSLKLFNSDDKKNIFEDETVGAFIGELTASAVSALCNARNDDYKWTVFDFLFYPSMANIVLTPICASIGVSLAGDKKKQKGSISEAFVGSIVGGLLGAVVCSVPGIMAQNRPVFLLGSTIGWKFGSLIGSVNAYNQ